MNKTHVTSFLFFKSWIKPVKRDGLIYKDESVRSHFEK